MKQEIKIILFLLFFTLVITFFSNKIYAATFIDLKAKFPDGRYWNHVTQSNHNSYRCEVEGCNKPDSTTDQPCVTHTGGCEVGKNDCNSFDGAIQCRGFGYKIFYDYYGVHYYDCPTHTDLNNIKPGDIIIYAGKYTPSHEEGGHTAWVTGIDEYNLYVTECNVGGINCVIRWNDKLPKSDIYSIVSIVSAPYEMGKIGLTAKINPYKPSELSWTEVEGAEEYRIQAINKDGILLENPDNIDRPNLSSGDIWITTETTYTRTLPAGDYEIYIEAFNSNGESIEKSNRISITSEEYPNKQIYFEDSNFEEYMLGYIEKMKSWRSFAEDGKIYFNDLPRGLPIGYSFYGVDFKWNEEYKCRMYIMDKNNNKNYDIEKYESIGSAWMNANLSADSFKNIKEITSVKAIGFYGMGTIEKFNNFIALFPNLESISIKSRDCNIKYDSFESLSKLKNLQELLIEIDETSDNLDYIAQIETLKQLTIYGTNHKKEVDFSFLKDLNNLKVLSVDEINIKDTKVNNSSIEVLGLNYLSLNGNRLINGLSNLRHVGLYCVGLPDGFNIKNSSIKGIDMYSSSLVNGMFNGATNLESLHIDSNHASSLGRLDSLLNLKRIEVIDSAIEDISGLKNIAQNGKLEFVDLTGNTLLNPNSRVNQPVFDILNKKGIEYKVDNYYLKDYVNSSNINILGLGTIGAFKTYKDSKVENLITEDNFPILETYDINVISHTGVGKSFGENVGSKDKVQIVNSLGEILQEYTVIVPGDVTGNGEVKLYDAFKILNDSVKKVAIDELDREIRDYNEDEKVTTYDALQYMKETIKE